MIVDGSIIMWLDVTRIENLLRIFDVQLLYLKPRMHILKLRSTPGGLGPYAQVCVWDNWKADCTYMVLSVSTFFVSSNRFEAVNLDLVDGNLL